MSKKHTFCEFQSVTLDCSQSLGTGRFGVTYQAMCDSLSCAGKLMRASLFEKTEEAGNSEEREARNELKTGRSGRGAGNRTKPRKKLVTAFQQEISQLRHLGHPHLAQYLGTSIDASSLLPILLMELCKESLASFLDKQLDNLPYHHEVELIHGVALGLAYLHNHSVTHGNLNAHNVLLTHGRTAKVSDYGMLDAIPSLKQQSLHYLCHPSYLPPEATLEPPNITPKLDCFSWGVVATQMLTQQPPIPPILVRTQSNGSDVSSSGQKSTLDQLKITLMMVESSHRLLPIIKSALRELVGHRPPMDAISQSLAALKQEEHFSESVRKVQTAPSEQQKLETNLKDAEHNLWEKEMEISELKEQVDDLKKQVGLCVFLQQQLKQRERLIGELREELTRKGRNIIGSRRSSGKESVREGGEGDKDRSREASGGSSVVEIRDKMAEGGGGEEKNLEVVKYEKKRERRYTEETEQASDKKKAEEDKEEQASVLYPEKPKKEKSDKLDLNARKETAEQVGTKQVSKGYGTERRRAQTEPVPLKEVDLPNSASRKFTYTSKKMLSPLYKKHSQTIISEIPTARTATEFSSELTVTVGTSAPIALARGSSAVDMKKQIAYIAAGSITDSIIYSCQYRSTTKNVGWLRLIECPRFEFSLAIVSGLLTAVGGYENQYQISKPTKTLLSLNENTSAGVWKDAFDPMPTKRRLPAVATTETLLVVAGGQGEKHKILNSVDVLYIPTSEWSTIHPLPIALSHASIAVCNAQIYITGGKTNSGPSQAVFSSQIQNRSSFAIRNQRSPKFTPWKTLPDTPTQWCTIVTMGEQLLAVGGQDTTKNCSQSIFTFYGEGQVWASVTTLRHKHSAAIVSPVSNNTMIVVGGYAKINEVTNSVEIVTGTFGP